MAFKVLIWNAQDWKNAATQTAANQARGQVLTRLLEDHQPDFVCLLETGTATNVNQYIAQYVTAAVGLTVDYTAPESILDRDASKSDHDKGMVAFWRDELKVQWKVWPRSDSERRSLVLFAASGMPTIGCIHAIAAGTASTQQIYELMQSVFGKSTGLELLAGDLNHEPEPARELPKKLQYCCTGKGTQGTPTKMKELDWGLQTSPPANWTATRIDAVRGVSFWKGSGGNVSDHAAILYTRS